MASVSWTPAANAQIGLYETARFDLSSASSTIGGNPVAVAWNGSKMYVAGLNSGTVATNVQIVEVQNATATGLNITPTLSAGFGPLLTVGSASRGYTGLAIKSNLLAATYDSGSNTPTAVQAFDTTTNTTLWNLSNSGTTTANIGTTRGYAGPDFDPGYQGVSGSGSGVAWVTQGQGRRFLNDPSTGAAIYTTTAGVPAGATQGMIINTNPTSTTWRDIAFDPATGDLYTRVNNNVTKTIRTGSNTNISVTGTVGQSTVIVPLTATNLVGTNVGYMNSVAASGVNTYAGDALVFNDRSTNGAWTSLIKFSTTSGSSISPTWTFLDAGPAAGTLYDFAWDSASQTLAVVDYTNRTASIFSTAVPEPSTYGIMAGAFAVVGLIARQRQAKG